MTTVETTVPTTPTDRSHSAPVHPRAPTATRHEVRNGPTGTEAPLTARRLRRTLRPGRGEEGITPKNISPLSNRAPVTVDRHSSPNLSDRKALSTPTRPTREVSLPTWCPCPSLTDRDSLGRSSVVLPEEERTGVPDHVREKTGGMGRTPGVG